MEAFQTYLELGFTHILDPNGYDHILFVLTLCGIYKFEDWKKILILVTAFTIGHSITLALAALDVVSVDAKIIELLIPVTILMTALYNLWKQRARHENMSFLYGITAFFGLIHGLGFSYFFKALLGREESIITPLLPFNIGVELGQIVIVFIGLLLSYIFIDLLKLKSKYWNYIISSIAIILSIQMILERI